MKKILTALLFTLFIISPAISTAQVKDVGQAEKKDASTKLEQFMSKKGHLFIKDYHKAGKISGEFGQYIEVAAVTIYEPGRESEKIKGLKIDVYEGGRLERTHFSFLDLDEVESLSKALQYMNDLAGKFKTDRREYTEVIFSSKGDFRIGFYQKGKDLNAFAESGIVASATCFFSADSLSELKDAVDKGLSLAVQ